MPPRRNSEGGGTWQIRPRCSTIEEAQSEIEGGADSIWWIGADGPALSVPFVHAGSNVSIATDLTDLQPGDEIRVELDRDVFYSIAKLRAVRVLWNRKFGTNPFIHAVGSERTLTRVDPWVNIMRQTTQAFAAVCGGADAITIFPYDEAGNEHTALGRRTARNTLLVLRHESQIAGDPAAGSYYLDWLTKHLVDGGKFEHEGAQQFTGISEFPMASETPLSKNLRPVTCDTSPSDAAAWEAMRDEPAGNLFLCKLGPPKDHGAAATFARNLFVSGGYTVIEGGPDEFDGSAVACIVGPGDANLPATKVLRNLDPKMDRLAFLRKLRS